jgi:hypothetical protein
MEACKISMIQYQVRLWNVSVLVFGFQPTPPPHMGKTLWKGALLWCKIFFSNHPIKLQTFTLEKLSLCSWSKLEGLGLVEISVCTVLPVLPPVTTDSGYCIDIILNHFLWEMCIGIHACNILLMSWEVNDLVCTTWTVYCPSVVSWATLNP